MDRHEPKSALQMIANRKQALEVEEFLRKWKKGQALLVTGPHGCGKTLAVRLAVKKLGLDLIESHAGEERGKDEIYRLLEASRQSGLFARKKVILVEEPDIIESRAALRALVEESSSPVVVISNSHSDLSKTCRTIRFGKVDAKQLSLFLLDVCRKEGIRMERTKAEEIAKCSDGDVRAALIDLEAADAGERDKDKNIFEALKMIFEKGTDARRYIVQHPEIVAWVQANVAQEHRDAESLATAYDALSKADIMMSRIVRRQSWPLQKYVADIIVLGLPKKKRVTLGSYQPPTRHSARPALEKIASGLHVSIREAAKQAYVVGAFADAGEFGFDSSDIEFLKSLLTA